MFKDKKAIYNKNLCMIGYILESDESCYRVIEQDTFKKAIWKKENCTEITKD